MLKTEITIPSIVGDQHFTVDYSDDDIVIIDNIRKLIDPIPTRLKMNLVAIGVKGRTEADLNGRRITLEERQLLLCPPNVTFSNFMISPDFEFKALFLTNRILQSFLSERINVWNKVMYILKMHIVTLGEEDIAFLSHFYEMLRLCISTKTGNPYRTEVIQSLLRCAFLGLCGTLEEMLPTNDALPTGSSDGLFRRFLDLLQGSSSKHRTVEHYASLLCITPKHLSTVCKKASGRTASEWIAEQVQEDIRFYLKQTDLSLKQICDRTGFPNTSFFGKYVKEHFGMTPLQFRRQRQ